MTKLSTYLLTLGLLPFSLLTFCENSLEDAVRAVENGQYQKADKLLLKIVQKKQPSLQKAKALRHLGTVKHKLNEERTLWIQKFEEAIKILNNLPNQKEELSRTYFQKANCLINSALIRAREQRHSELSSIDLFNLLNDYVTPAQNSLTRAQANYPKQLKADILLLQADIKLLMGIIGSEKSKSHLKQLTKMYANTYEFELKNNPNPRADVLSASLLRQVIILRQNGENDQALEISKKSLEVKSENRELNLEAKLQYAANRLLSNEKAHNLTDLEELLLKSINEVELMRLLNTQKKHYFLSKQYLSKRLSAYELLLDVYGRQDKVHEMLSIIDQMKARAFKSTTTQNNYFYPKLDLTAVQKQLKRDNAVAVEYFLGANKSWIFIISKDALSYREINKSAHQIVSLTKNVISGYTDLTLLRHYKATTRKPEQYQKLLEVYQNSNELYKLLLEPLESLKYTPNSIYLIPHDVTNYLPFSALVKQLNKENLLKSEFYAEKSAPLTFLPSLSLLTNKPSKYYTGKSKVFYRAKFNNGFYDLPNSKTEAENIAETIGAKLYSEKEFIKSKIIGTEPLNILYLASHVDNRPSKPNKHAVILSSWAKENLSVEDLILNCKDKIKTNLTILSLCQTNRGEKIPTIGDDLSNLSRAFLIAGSKSVLTSQWVVTDDHTPQILEKLINNYINGATPAKALDGAIKQYLNTVKSPFHRHPFYWGNLIILQREPVK